jgi:hypothetical protein
MSTTVTDHEIRLAVVRLLEQKSYKVTSTAAGSGIPKYSRIEIDDGTTTLSCAIKVTRGGRISFMRDEDGSYAVLRNSDRIIHAKLILDGEPKVRVSMFERATVIKAFDENHSELAKQGMGHIPLWVNPDYEPSRRMTGSGFQKDSLWSEVVPIHSLAAEESLPSITASAATTAVSTREQGILERIKSMLSEHMGVRPELIEIDIRVKL